MAASTTMGSTDMAAATDPPCRLLELPGELKNRIFRLVLVTSTEDHRIAITTTGFERSNLVRTCKEVYADTLRLYFVENSFWAATINYDATNMMKFQDIIAAAKTYGTIKETDRVRVHHLNFMVLEESKHYPLWSNLTMWLRYLHGGTQVQRTIPPSLPSTGSKRLQRPKVMRDIIRNMSALAIELRDQPWSRVEKILNGMRRSLVRAERKFAD